MNITVIGDNETVTGFRLAGIRSAYSVKTQTIKEVLGKVLSDGKTEIIVITENFANFLREDIEKIKERGRPIIVEVPDKNGPQGYAQKSIQEIIKRAVGIEIGGPKENKGGIK